MVCSAERAGCQSGVAQVIDQYGASEKQAHLRHLPVDANQNLDEHVGHGSGGNLPRLSVQIGPHDLRYVLPPQDTPRHNGNVEYCNRILAEEFPYARE